MHRATCSTCICGLHTLTLVHVISMVPYTPTDLTSQCQENWLTFPVHLTLGGRGMRINVMYMYVTNMAEGGVTDVIN